MRAITIMYDSLNRKYLPCYGDMVSIMPNFRRLQEKTVTFDRFYVGSLPCIPARRELHTGRYNFMHRCWGPLMIPWQRIWAGTGYTPIVLRIMPITGRREAAPTIRNSLPAK